MVFKPGMIRWKVEKSSRFMRFSITQAEMDYCYFNWNNLAKPDCPTGPLVSRKDEQTSSREEAEKSIT